MEQPAKPHPAESGAAKEIREAFQSAHPLIYIRSAEEDRINGALREAGKQLSDSAPVPVWTWTLTEGMRSEKDEARGKPARAAGDAGGNVALAALDFIAAHDRPAIFHLKDFHEPLRQSPEVRRRLRDLYAACLDRRKFVVISSPVRFVPEEVERDLVYIELGLPDDAELTAFLRDEAGRISAAGMTVDSSDAAMSRISVALRGLTLSESRHALRRAMAENGNLGVDSLPALLEEKRLLINRSGVVEFIPDNSDLAQIGGLQGLKTWLQERRKLFDMRDSLRADIVPKGVLLMGIPGCGKSQSVKAIASQFGLPLYRIDMVEIFSGRHGKPEVAFVGACKMLEGMAPSVVWFDEIEMGVTSKEAGGEQGRIFAFFLTWMQEKARGLFVAATANRIDLLPAEMIRKGRFDEVFFFDLPIDEERIEIFKIHLSRREVDPAKYDLKRMVGLTKGWTGAEIEQCVVAALTKARIQDHEMTEEDLFDAAAEIIPLSRTMKEQIAHIRQWAFERAVRATPRQV
ncbi:MAG: AAA family ATPase [Candidatus Binataceae bacterium]